MTNSSSVFLRDELAEDATEDDDDDEDLNYDDIKEDIERSTSVPQLRRNNSNDLAAAAARCWKQQHLNSVAAKSATLGRIKKRKKKKQFQVILFLDFRMLFL